HAIVLAREEELSHRWGWGKRFAVSLGGIVLLAALVCGIIFGLRHLPQRASTPASSGEVETEAAASAQMLPKVQLSQARTELDAGHYATAEALFREAAAVQPNVLPAADLAAALQLWEHGQFAQATSALQRFVRLKPVSPFVWLNGYKRPAQDRIDDSQLYSRWEKERDATRDPQTSLKRIREITSHLKAKGALAFQLADEEAKLSAEVAQVTARKAEEEKKRATEEAPKWRAALGAERRAIAGYQFAKGRDIIESTRLSAASLQKEREEELQRSLWLADWKSKLISDLNQTGYGGSVTDIHGLRYDGPVHRATSDKLELKTRYGSVMTDWLNLSPPMLLTISRAFLRPQGADAAEREWLCAIFAAQTGQAKVGRELAQQAAKAEPQYRDLLPRYFPDAK
ncbi:MAG TPA: hypothetical protein VGF73_06145, partial [Chthoniobacterales bacterium]